MNKIINNSLVTSLVVSILLGVFFLYSYETNVVLFLFNCLTIISYYIVLKVEFQNNNKTVLKLIFITLIYQFITITALTQLYISYNGVPFSFTARDSLTYDLLAKDYLNNSFSTAISLLVGDLPLDDLGFPVYLSFVYRLSSDPLLSRYLLIIVIILITVIVYKISQNYLSNRYAFMAAISISIANFNTLYASNGLKELFMELILMTSFYYLLRFINDHKNIYLFIAILISLLLFFFRIPMVLMFFVTIAISFLFYKGKKPVFIIFLSFIIVVSTYFLYNYFSEAINRFTEMSTEDAVEKSAEYVGESGPFTFFVSIIAGLFGPLPTLFPKFGKEDLSFIGGVLVFRVFLSGYIFASIYYIYKNRISKMYPLIIYPLITIISLILISEVYEFRFHLPHIALFFILGFYGIENQLLKGVRLTYINIIQVILIIYWNFGRM